EQVRAVDVFHGIENDGMPDQLVGPGEQQMRFAAQRATQWSTEHRFGLLEPAAIRQRLVGGQRAYREVIAIAPERLDLRGREDLGTALSGRGGYGRFGHECKFLMLFQTSIISERRSRDHAPAPPLNQLAPWVKAAGSPSFRFLSCTS